ncbi:hypothetical protein [Leuconostoc falkenbergense]|jgi:aryl-alcohol dehydrogenase-like predicted oxidoreductase|uniref:hypothetical protein n=1 Tax=Leuconostoc falkenbergense TaxID=2766470 RepID=UPI00117563C3|nr:hypothetical protein [Leuconostoc falkenbergense]VTU70577.1 hypothetical protein AMBR_MGDJBKAP_01446 [Leuconostoc pseudomesenteroides]
MNKSRQLGNTDLYLSPLGLGTWQYSTKDSGGRSMWGNTETETVCSYTKKMDYFYSVRKMKV